MHRPHVAGIHGREEEGAYSIVLSGGYEDDVDEGEQFTYSGSGGRDLSGNKRTAKQSMDQKLTAMNRWEEFTIAISDTPIIQVLPLHYLLIMTIACNCFSVDTDTTSNPF